jgi:hypothetical protein
MNRYVFLILSTLACHTVLAQKPVALNDTVNLLSQTKVAVNVLQNDFDPQGRVIVINTIKPGGKGIVYSDSNGIVHYDPHKDFSGKDSIRYIIKNDLGLLSNWAYIFFIVSPNPSVPVARPDTATCMAEVGVEVNFLSNDNDPTGEPLEALLLQPKHGSGYKKQDSIYHYQSKNYTGLDSLGYRLRDTAGYYSAMTYIRFNVLHNPAIPQAVNDTMTTLAADAVFLKATANDHDPENGPLRISKTTQNPKNALKWAVLNDSVIMYCPKPDFSGTDTIGYVVSQKNAPYYYDEGSVFIRVEPNPGIPVAKDDTVAGIAFTEILIDPLKNDHNSTGDSLEIWKIFPSTAKITSDQKILVTPDCNCSDPYRLNYTIRRIADTSYFSSAQILVNLQMNYDYPIPVTDTIVTSPILLKELNLLLNDHLPDPTDTLRIINLPTINSGTLLRIGDSSIRFKPFPYAMGSEEVQYSIISNKGKLSKGQLVIRVENNSFDYLDVNDVKARINAFGNHFYSSQDSIGFEVPKGSGQSSVFSTSLWVSGRDEEGTLHVAAERFRQGNYSIPGRNMDFWAGPVMDTSFYSPQTDDAFYRVWKISRQEVDFHKQHYLDPGYFIPESIATWPGNGNQELGQAPRLARFADMNNNGIYEPATGDYPEIFGDQTIFFIFNDDRDKHTESYGEKLGLEIHGWAYAFDLPEDTALNHSLFFHYEIFNRSAHTYVDTYLGLFSDLDLGFGKDDYIGYDVERKSAFIYNGKEIDGNGEPRSYGAHPPAQSLTMLEGPLKDQDGLDNPSMDLNGHPLCDESYTGSHFGDTIIDNERLGPASFIAFSNPGYSSGPEEMTDPYRDTEFDTYLHGHFKDDYPITYGGTGYTIIGTPRPECKYMFPWESDSLNTGIGCTPLPGEKMWSEQDAGNLPTDRRGLINAGPFIFRPGGHQQIDFAFIYGRHYTGGPQASVQALKENIDHILLYYNNNTLPNGKRFIEPVSSLNYSGSIIIYPNPAQDQIYFILQSVTKTGQYLLLNSMGMTVQEGLLTPGQVHRVDRNGLQAGLYLLVVKAGEASYLSKFIFR